MSEFSNLYFQSEDKQLHVHEGDVIESLQTLSSESADVVFADPPFNLGKKYGSKSNDRRDDYRDWCKQWIKECFRVLKPTGSLFLMTVSKHAGWKSAAIENKINLTTAENPDNQDEPVFINQIMWMNQSASHDKRRFLDSHQPILFYGKTENYYFSRYGEIDTRIQKSWSKERAARQVGQLKDIWNDIPFIYAGSVCHQEALLKPGTKEKIHIAQMPLGLIRRAVKFACPPGGTLVEPFMGSGAGLVIAHESCLNYHGIDIEKSNCDLAVSRLSNAGLFREPLLTAEESERIARTAGLTENGDAIGRSGSYQPTFNFEDV